MDNYVELIEYYYDKPAEFAEDFLSFSGDEKQRQIMESIRDNRRTTVRSGQGVGKTATVACVVIWFLCTRYNAKVIATAPNITQLYTVLWAEIAKWLQDSALQGFLTQTKTRLYMNDYEKTWFAFPKTATTAEGIAGQHADHMLVIADEASGIKDEILETLLGTITGADNRLLFISNPTRRSGTFYDSFHKNAALFSRIHIDAEKCQRVDKENLEMLATSYGKDSNVYLVRAKGEFPRQEDDVLIPLDLVSAAIDTDPPEDLEISAIKIGVDVARFGADDTVIAVNVDGDVCDIIKRHGNDTTQTTGETIKAARAARDQLGGIHNVVVIVDDTGVGGGVTDQLRHQKKELGLDWLYVIPVNAAQSVNSAYYQDATTYMWAAIKELMDKGELRLPDDADMIGQLTTRKFKIMPNGKIKLESKDDMKKRGLKSPDIGDALALSCWPVNYSKLFNGARVAGKRASGRQT